MVRTVVSLRYIGQGPWLLHIRVCTYMKTMQCIGYCSAVQLAGAGHILIMLLICWHVEHDAVLCLHCACTCFCSECMCRA